MFEGNTDQNNLEFYAQNSQRALQASSRDLGSANGMLTTN